MFFDAILVYSVTWQAHLLHLQQVFKLLLHHKLFLKLFKCDIRVSQVEYLSHIINSHGVAMDSKIVSSIIDWPVPKSLKELKGFLGLTGYYRHFIKGYGAIARPLTGLLKKR